MVIALESARELAVQYYRKNETLGNAKADMAHGTEVDVLKRMCDPI